MSSIDVPYRRMPSYLRTRAAPADDRQSMTRATLAAIMLYLILIPQQFEFVAGGLKFAAYRIFLIGASVYILSSAMRANLRFAWADAMITLGIGWITIASYISSGEITEAVVQGGSHFVDIGLAYFLARTTIQTPTDLRRFLVLVAPGVAFIGLTVAIEAIGHRLIVQDVVAAITGKSNPIRLEVRKGFMRGTSTFAHPILVGIFLASFLPIYLLSGLRGWPRMVGVSTSILGLFSMSSAAVLGIIVGGCLFVYDWLTERIANLTWKLFLGFSAILYFFVEMTSNRGFYTLLVQYASLNSVSAYNRIHIWNFGTENIARHPWFGIGYADWDRPSWMHSGSFDWLWLIFALRFGIPVAVLMLGATLLAVAMLALNSRHLPPSDARLLRGVAISLGVFALGLNSVSLWMNSLAWFFMLVGLSVSLGSARQPRQVTAQFGTHPQQRRRSDPLQF